MSRTIRHPGKGGGYEYWSRRPGNGLGPCRENKKITLHIERAKEREMLYSEIMKER